MEQSDPTIDILPLIDGKPAPYGVIWDVRVIVKARYYQVAEDHVHINGIRVTTGPGQRDFDLDEPIVLTPDSTEMELVATTFVSHTEVYDDERTDD